MHADEAYQKRLTPARRAASAMLNEIIVELYRIREWFDWMNPIPPMSAARLKTQSQPATASLQFSTSRRSTLQNSSQKSSCSMYSFSFQSAARTQCPSALSRFARCEPMKPPAPAMQIFFTSNPSVSFVLLIMMAGVARARGCGVEG